jgi:uncharacterized membrane protein
MNRLYIIDNLRGIAFILMIIHHINYFYDVSNDYTTTLSQNPLVDASGTIARYLFIILAGISVYLSYKNNKKTSIKKRFYKSLEVAIHALIITITTYILYPKYFIRFGILHFLSIATFLISFIAPYKYLTIIIFILSIIFKFPTINPFADTITGANHYYNAMDWFNLNSWLPIILLGLIIGQNIDFDKINILKNNNIITKIGNNSLNLYTIHVVILLIFFKFYK